MDSIHHIVKRVKITHAHCNIDTFKQYRDTAVPKTFCQACPRYAKSWACPPLINKIDFTPFKEVWLIGVQAFVANNFLQPASSPKTLQEMSEGAIATLRKQIDPLLYTIERSCANSRLFLPGSCHLCTPTSCTRADNHPCRHPDLVRPSLEAMGFNVTRPAADLLHIDLLWAQGLQLPAYLTLIAAIFTDSASRIPDFAPLYSFRLISK